MIIFSRGEAKANFSEGHRSDFGHVSLLKGVVVRYAPFMHFYYKIHTSVPYFESSTTTEMLILYNCCKQVAG